MENQYFRLKCAPGFELGGRTFDYLVFEYTDKLPERGYFAAHAPEWGDAWRLCRVVPAENCCTGEPFPYCEDGSEYPKDACVFGVLKYGYIEFDQLEGSEHLTNTQEHDNVDRLLEYINAQPNPREFMLAMLSLGANHQPAASELERG